MLDILFIDDEEDIHFIISQYNIEEVTNFRIKKYEKSAIEALKLLEKESFDLIITDIRMPVMDGLEFLERLKEIKPEQNVIIASTYSEFEYARRALRLGALDYLVKPITKESLIETLENAEKIIIRDNKHEMADNLITQKDIEEIYFRLMKESIDTKEIAENIKRLEEKIGDDNKAYNEIISQLYLKLKESFSWLDNIIGFEPDSISGVADFENALKRIEELIVKFELKKQNSILNNICNTVAENIYDSSVFDIVADKVELSKDYIGRLFKKSFGMTFNEYISMMKMECAKHLLTDSNFKIYEISEKLGYKTVDYFSRLFKAYAGITPMQYRQKRIIDK